MTSILTTTLPLFALLFVAQTFLAIRFRTFINGIYSLLNLTSLIAIGLICFTDLLAEYSQNTLVLTAFGVWAGFQTFLLSKTFIQLVGASNGSEIGVGHKPTQQAVMHHLALHDATTGLPNKHALHKWSKNSPTSQQVLCVIKLSEFAHINQTLGYQTADLVLIQIAQRINKALQPIAAIEFIESDKKLVALGGVRFAFVLDTQDSTDQYQGVYQTIRTALPDPIPYESMMLSLSFEMGISSKITNAKQIDDCIQQAQTAVDYDGKNKENFAIYSNDMDIFNQNQQKLLADLSQAVKLQQLALFSQPIIDLSNKQFIAAESLIRWRHPDMGLIEPERFIQLAERTGVIYSITQWVVKTSIAACSQWHQQDLKVKISINLASKDLLQHEFVDFINEQLQKHNLAAHFVILEIREQALMQEPAIAHSIIERLAGIGIKVVIDDFGTGFSSLAHLRALPLYGIKIDRQFIKLMSKGTKHKTLVNTMVDLSRNLHRKVFAEGLEDPEQENVLKSMGCNFAQGFIYSRPLEIDGISIWAKQWQAQFDNLPDE
ncbi:putative bifunctional diguanylate cyclase/phosphodiesterase [Catenovulum sp. SX2]|uniref:putative bifunctional diguanylate cyclase/phosphodiesterase n=1 Tax=Catenovulum sp. SX2 TaxID=3398614 RepID=UPI003F83D998